MCRHLLTKIKTNFIEEFLHFISLSERRLQLIIEMLQIYPKQNDLIMFKTYDTKWVKTWRFDMENFIFVLFCCVMQVWPP